MKIPRKFWFFGLYVTPLCLGKMSSKLARLLLRISLNIMSTAHLESKLRTQNSNLKLLNE